MRLTFASELNPPHAESMSESDTCVMEKRDTLEGETVNLECFAAGFLGVALGVERGGGGEPDAILDVGRGSNGKSSSHSYPAPAVTQQGNN